MGQRTDAMQRPELCFGSVEFVATKDYCKVGRSRGTGTSQVTVVAAVCLEGSFPAVWQCLSG